LKSWQIENYQVAHFYNLDPSVVENWTNIDFLNRQEYMMFQNEIDYLILNEK